MIKIICEYFKITEPRKSHIVLLLITSVFTNIPYMLTPLVYSMFIKYLTVQNLNMSIWIIVIYFSLKIISKIFGVFSNKIQQKYFERVYFVLQQKIINKMEQLNINHFHSKQKSSLINTANVDIKELANFSLWLINTLLLIISFFIATVVLASINIYLMLFAIIINSLVVYLLNIYNKKFEKIIQNMKSRADKETSFFSQILNGIYEIKIFPIMEQLNNKYLVYNNNYIEANNQKINNEIKKNILTPTITMIAEMLLVIYSIYSVIQGSFGIDTVLTINSYFGTMFSNLTQIITAMGELRVINVAINRYQEIINSDDVDYYGNKFLKLKNAEVRFSNISMAYQGEMVLEKINLIMCPNTITTLIGESGSGKSTIAAILMRFFKEKTGEIFINNININELSKEFFQKNITIVKQDSFFFDLSIYENLSLISNDYQKNNRSL